MSESELEKKPTVKKRVLRYTRNLLLAMLILVLLLVGAGLAYTWYMGQNSDGNPVAEPIEAKPREDYKPAPRAVNAKIGAAIQYITSPVEPGSNASITVRSSPEAACKIKVEYNKVASKDSGLVAKAADEYGMVSWTWTVEPVVPLGKWPATVTCTLNGKSAVVIGDLVVSRQVQE